MEHQFNVQLAQKYGIEEAILIHNLFFWINKNAANEKHLYDGNYWTYNTQKALSDLFPYIHETKIQRSLKKLCESGVIIKGNYNKNKLDRTCWYAFTKEALTILQNAGYDISKMKNANSQDEATIPYSKHTDSNTDNKEDTNVSKKEDFSSKMKTNKQDVYKEIVDYWNEHTKSYSKVRQVTAKIKSAINARIKDGYSVDDIKKALLLCESLGDFYKGKEAGKNWKASFYWIICNTNSNFDKILAGDLHTSNEQQRDFRQVMGSSSCNANEYYPSTGGSINWDERNQCYRCFNPWDLYDLADGYKPDTRPDGAVIYCQATKYVWSKKEQRWIETR